MATAVALTPEQAQQIIDRMAAELDRNRTALNCIEAYAVAAKRDHGACDNALSAILAEVKLSRKRMPSRKTTIA